MFVHVNVAHERRPASVVAHNHVRRSVAPAISYKPPYNANCLQESCDCQTTQILASAALAAGLCGRFRQSKLQPEWIRAINTSAVGQSDHERKDTKEQGFRLRQWRASNGMRLQFRSVHNSISHRAGSARPLGCGWSSGSTSCTPNTSSKACCNAQQYSGQSSDSGVTQVGPYRHWSSSETMVTPLPVSAPANMGLLALGAGPEPGIQGTSPQGRPVSTCAPMDRVHTLVIAHRR